MNHQCSAPVAGKARSSVRRSFERRALAQFAAATISCALIASAALFHIHVRTRVTEEGYRLSRLSAEHQKLSREHERLELSMAQLESPQRLSELSRARLKMGPPAGDRVVVLADRTARTATLLAAQ
jgi:cell division protein FtsL